MVSVLCLLGVCVCTHVLYLSVALVVRDGDLPMFAQYLPVMSGNGSICLHVVNKRMVSETRQTIRDCKHLWLSYLLVRCAVLCVMCLLEACAWFCAVRVGCDMVLLCSG